MKRSSVPSRRSSGTSPSPGTPNYGSNMAGLHKGWSSVRVPLPSNNGSGRPPPKKQVAITNPLESS
ncbi:hypothetical protein QJS10_CPB17g00575 [Acorus calamus]|uniref:Uncharacterized protein n=1 Tax=Acorus calamus TaxID=4465 RepID=A0AAV9CTK5_ACOCL|nr:hypothetical protein QJS10_CPB17g00575 [Acorus calamus]